MTLTLNSPLRHRGPKLAVQPKLNRTVDVNIDVLRLVRNGRIRRDPAFVVFVLSCEDLDHR